jgi:hypothetical protein
MALIYHENRTKHRYYCWATDALRLVGWLVQQRCRFEYEHVSSGDDPDHIITCGLKPEDLSSRFEISRQ